MGDRKSNFVFALGYLRKCMRNKSRLAALFLLCRANLPRFDARIWPHFHEKTCGHTSPLSSTHTLACRPHFLIRDYCYLLLPTSMFPSFGYQRSIGFSIVPIRNSQEDAECSQKQFPPKEDKNAIVNHRFLGKSKVCILNYKTS